MSQVVEASVKEMIESGRVTSGKDTVRVSLQLFMRNYEARMKHHDTTIDKYRLKLSAMRAAKAKTDASIRQKEANGEVLHPVDFNQLKIENQQYLEKIEDRNIAMLKLKTSAGKTVQMLNRYNQHLQVQAGFVEKLEQDIASRNAMIKRVEAEYSVVESEQLTARAEHDRLRKNIERFRVPSTMEYVREKAELQQLQKDVGAWAQRVRVAEQNVSRYKRIYKEAAKNAGHM